MDLTAGQSHGPSWSALVTRPFAVAIVMLGGAAILSVPVSRWLGVQHGKKPLPLKAALASLDAVALRPYEIRERHVLEPAVVEALGTERYLNWTLEDTSVPLGSPVRFANLFVTYYTGGHHLVPHTPDVCFLGHGYQPAQPHTNEAIEVGVLEGALPIRVCTFNKTGIFNQEKVTTVYTFHCNGDFVATRTGVRVRVNNPTHTHSYFSKVEVSFPRATREQSVEAARKLFHRVLPILIHDHWPDFAAAEAAVDD